MVVNFLKFLFCLTHPRLGAEEASNPETLMGKGQKEKKKEKQKSELSSQEPGK